MMQAHHESSYRYLSRQYPGWQLTPVRLALRLGLAARAFIGRLSPAVGAGAKPTRRADVIRD
jgi:N-acetylglucosaminyl-diphospho-decaprenol L-rhamnosyltransferase